MKSLIDTEKIKAFIEDKYPSSSNEVLKNFVYQLWETFQKYGLQDSAFVTEFTSGSGRIQRLGEYYCLGNG